MARVQTPSHLRRSYDCVYLIDQALEEPAVDKQIEKYRDLVTKKGGRVVQLETWGKRRLAYLIDKQPRATYVNMQFLGTGDMIVGLERTMKLSEEIIRWLTIVTEDHADPESRPEVTKTTKKITEEEPPFGEASDSRTGYRGDSYERPGYGGAPRRDESDDAEPSAKPADDAEPSAKPADDAEPSAKSTDDAEPSAKSADDAEPSAKPADDAEPSAKSADDAESTEEE